MKKISAMTFDGETWSGWSNSGGTEYVKSLEHAVSLVDECPETIWRIIDADNLKIYVSNMQEAEYAIRSAKVNFNVDIPIENVVIGFPENL